MPARKEPKPIPFPVRLHGLDRVEVICLPRPMGGSAKAWLREEAKRLPEYHQPIETGISGRTDSGKEIPINSVGRWFFGTPGYMGHVRVSNWEGYEAKIEWPSQAPDAVHLLVAKLKAKVEGTTATSNPSGDVLERAMRLVCKERPDASMQRKAAFANSVQYLVTGLSGGFGGPSIREYAASYMYAGRRFPFEAAVELLLRDDGPIFGPITDLHRQVWRDEHCFDDDFSDVEKLES